MSCAEVMYQPYTPYFPYQRPMPTASATATSQAEIIPIAPYELKKFGVPRMHEPMEQGSPDFVLSNGGSSSSSSAAGATNGGTAGSSSASSSPTAAAVVSSRVGTTTTSSARSSSSDGIGGHGGSGHHSHHHGHHAHGRIVSSASAATNARSNTNGSRSSTTSGALHHHHHEKQHCTSGSGLVTNSASGGSSSGHSSTVKSEMLHATDAQYISANCVLFTYYSGDISSVVDEHFSRALSQTSSGGYSSQAADSVPSTSKGLVTKDSSPMAQRNFPPSFWNSNYMYHQGTSGSGTGGPHLSLGGHGHHELSYAAASDPYHHAAASGSLHHGIHHQGDPWHYSYPPHAHRPTAMHELAAYSSMASMPSTSRFQPAPYGSLLLQPSGMRTSRLGHVPPQCAAAALGKPSDGWSAPRYHEHLATDISHLDAANYGGGHAYSSMGSMPGLEGPVQDSAKDLYWF